MSLRVSDIVASDEHDDRRNLTLIQLLTLSSLFSVSSQHTRRTVHLTVKIVVIMREQNHKSHSIRQFL